MFTLRHKYLCNLTLKARSDQSESESEKINEQAEKIKNNVANIKGHFRLRLSLDVSRPYWFQMKHDVFKKYMLACFILSA